MHVLSQFLKQAGRALLCAVLFICRAPCGSSRCWLTARPRRPAGFRSTITAACGYGGVTALPCLLCASAPGPHLAPRTCCCCASNNGLPGPSIMISGMDHQARPGPLWDQGGEGGVVFSWKSALAVFDVEDCRGSVFHSKKIRKIPVRCFKGPDDIPIGKNEERREMLCSLSSSD